MGTFQIDRWAQLLVRVSVHVCDCDVCVHECVHCELAYVCVFVWALVGVVCGLVFVCIMVGVYGSIWVEKDFGDEVCCLICCWRYQLTDLK